MPAEQSETVDFSYLAHRPQSIAEFVARIAQGIPVPRWPEERRVASRFTVSIPVEVQPVSGELWPEGEPYKVITRDISIQGIGFQDTRPVQTPYLAIKVLGPHGEIDLLATTVRCKQLGNVYEIGCQFVSSSLLAHFFDRPLD